MTRFARAKGSKSSNLKAADDSTPWEVMKEQMLQAKKESEDNKNRQLAENQRIENYSNFLKEQKISKRKATWCEFPVPEGSKKAKKQLTSGESKLDENKPIKNKSKKANVDKDQHTKELNNQETVTNNIVNSVSIKKKKKKKDKSKAGKVVSDLEQNVLETSANTEEVKHVQQKSNKKKKFKTETSITKSEGTDNQPNKPGAQTSDGAQTKRGKKKKGDKPTRRKEINDRSFQLIINGKEIELMRYDGFPIMKKDAERLDELKSSMIKKGIPKSEVNRTIKLERRRAEKALARLKKDVCYNCRKGGHNLSDCPELKSNIPGVDAATGVCFKCGSTEHRQFECKVQRDKEFRFASCFICKEQGHIARQCPDNPKGLYPNGGCCKICGDVTHLKKDCPSIQTNKEGTSIKLQTLDTGSNIEDIDLQSKPVLADAPKKPKKIKF